jgi:hypothetical protein
MTRARLRSTFRQRFLAGLGIAAAAYAATASVAWFRYGRHAGSSSPDEADALLDRFMPDYEVVERHRIHVHAPAETTLAAAAETDLGESAIVRAIFTAREVVLGAAPDTRDRPRGLLAQVASLGWGVLATVPDREVVVGAVTRPWLANVVFRALPPEAFSTFQEPGYVKIVWTLRADPAGSGDSIFRTETRVTTTDAAARAKFRWYWARFSPGIVLIRRIMLRHVKNEAERRARGGAGSQNARHPSQGVDRGRWPGRTAGAGPGAHRWFDARRRR